MVVSSFFSNSSSFPFLSSTINPPSSHFSLPPLLPPPLLPSLIFRNPLTQTFPLPPPPPASYFIPLPSITPQLPSPSPSPLQPLLPCHPPYCYPSFPIPLPIATPPSLPPILPLSSPYPPFHLYPLPSNPLAPPPLHHLSSSVAKVSFRQRLPARAIFLVRGRNSPSTLVKKKK